jgi:hypothetical protein
VERVESRNLYRASVGCDVAAEGQSAQRRIVREGGAGADGVPEESAAVVAGKRIESRLVRQRVEGCGHASLSIGYTLRNETSHPVEIRAPGIPMTFDNIIGGKMLAQALPLHRKRNYIP